MKPEAKSNIIVSQRGQITLPSDVRKRLGIKEGAVLTLEERKGELVLRPAAVFEIEMYSDSQISSWVEKDKIDETSRKKLNKKPNSKS
jgi:AbrB family looped-hinge helix DNA binding protein